MKFLDLVSNFAGSQLISKINIVQLLIWLDGDKWNCYCSMFVWYILFCNEKIFRIVSQNAFLMYLRVSDIQLFLKSEYRQKTDIQLWITLKLAFWASFDTLILRHCINLQKYSFTFFTVSLCSHFWLNLVFAIHVSWCTPGSVSQNTQSLKSTETDTVKVYEFINWIFWIAFISIIVFVRLFKFSSKNL